MRRWAVIALGVMVSLGLVGMQPLSASADELPPLVIVFDVSGSMNDKGPSGEVKLTTAKQSVSALVREQPARVRLGVWTYPGGSTVDGCAAGSWINGLAPDQQPDSTDVDAQVRLLEARGDTPTGPALTSVTKSLQAMGYRSATIVLVSDGESNCGTPPCDVAKGVVDAGFDLTVAAVAFDLKSAKSDELQCVADVTGGTFTRAEDAGDLIDALSKYHAQDLELTVDVPDTVMAGSHVSFTATVTNSSAVEVAGASLLISVDDRSLVPYVPSPQYLLPAIPPGGSITRTWVVGTASNYSDSTGWRVLAGSSGAGSVMETGDLTLTTGLLSRSDGGDVLANRSGTVVILGDSYSSGEGIGIYEDPDNPCHRSVYAYGEIVGGSTVEMIACSGAISRQLTKERQYADEPPQLEQLRKLQKSGETVDMVYLTVGGNDIDFAGIVTACFLGDCSGDQQAYLRAVNDRGNYEDLYISIAEQINRPQDIKDRHGALAPVVVSPYPDPFWEPSRGKCNGFDGTFDPNAVIWIARSIAGVVADDVGFSPNEISVGKQVLTGLNRQVETGVQQAQESGYPVFYADSVVGLAAGHSICETDSYYRRLNPENAVAAKLEGTLNELFHPNSQGHQAWANAIITWSQRTTFDASATVPAPPPPVFQGMLDALNKLLSPLNPSQTEVSATLEGADDSGVFPAHDQTYTVTPGGTLDLHLTDLRPGSTVTVVVRSEAETLASMPVDDNGVASASVQLPNLSSGSHTLTLTGYDDGFQFVGKQIDLTVHSGVPVGVIPLVLLQLVAVIVLVRGIIRIRSARDEDQSVE